MSKIWFSMSLIGIFIICIITFIILDVFSSKPEKLSNQFITFTIENQPSELFSGTDENGQYFYYNLIIETSFSENFKNIDLTYSENVRAEPKIILGKSATYEFKALTGTSIQFVFSTSNYETKIKNYQTVYKVDGQTQIFAESIENLPNIIELEISNTFALTYTILPSNANVCNVNFVSETNSCFNLENEIITALEVGNGSISVYLNDVMIKTISLNIIAEVGIEEQNDYFFDISLTNNYDDIEFNSTTNVVTLEMSNFVASVTVSFNIILKNNEETSFLWQYSITDIDNIIAGSPSKPAGCNSLAITFSKTGQILIEIFNTDLNVSKTITVNVLA